MQEPDLSSIINDSEMIEYSSKAKKGKKALPGNVKFVHQLLEQDIRETNGKPYGRGWDSLGEVTTEQGEAAMHCHLTYRYVAVWRVLQKDGKVVCRFLYIGSREKIPY